MYQDDCSSGQSDLCAGMAGSGKTTLVQQMNAYMSMHKKAGYLINLDPAVRTLPYDPNIDIRDTVCSFPVPYQTSSVQQSCFNKGRARIGRLARVMQCDKIGKVSFAHCAALLALKARLR